MNSFSESDLYEPVKKLFIEMGFDVRSEVKDCDIVAVKQENTIVAELKKSFNITLVYQLLQRQTFCKNVYAVIPRPKKGAKDKNWKNMLKLCKRLDFGVITVAIDSPTKLAQIICSPEGITKITNYKQKKSVEKEMVLRSEDFNKGGINCKKIVTVYREKAIKLLCVLKKEKTLTSAKLKELGYDKSEYSVLYNNFYKWFTKIEKGVYCISEEGEKALINEEYKNVVEFYSKSV